jgi:hypothetical protein
MRNLCVAALLAVAAGLAAVTAGCGSKPVAKVNGQVISEDQFYQALQSGRTNARIAATTLDAMITRNLIFQAAKQRNVAPSESDLAEARAQYTQMAVFQREWDPLFRSKLASEEDLTQEMEFVIDVSRMFIGTDALRKFFNAHHEQFDRPAQVRFQRLGVKTQAEAEQIRQAILAKKATFEGMIRTKSIEPNHQADGGWLGPAPEGFAGSKNKALEAVLFSIPLKRLSEPIQVAVWSGPGRPLQTEWHLVMVGTRVPKMASKWENSWYAVMLQALGDPDLYRKIGEGVDKLKNEANIEILPPKYAGLAQQYSSMKQRPPTFGTAVPPVPGKAAPPAKAGPGAPGQVVPPVPPGEAPTKAAPPTRAPSKAGAPGGQ